MNWEYAAYVACAIALLYSVVWPRRRVNANCNKFSFRYLVLRWAHSLVWVFLALVFFKLAGILALNGFWFYFFAWGALCLYLVFMAVFSVSKAKKSVNSLNEK